MSASDEDGPGQKPKQPASSTLAGMPAPKEGTPAPGRAPLPPPKAPPGGRAHAPSTSPPFRREVSGAGPLPQAPQSGPHAFPPSGAAPAQPPGDPHAAPHAHPSQPSEPASGFTPQSGPHPYPATPPPGAPHAYPSQPPSGPTPQSGPHGFSPQQTAPLAFPPQPSQPHTTSPFSAHAAAQHQPAFVSQQPPHHPSQHGLGPYPGPHPMTQQGLGALGQHGPQPGDSMEDVPGSQFVKFLKISSKRAFRLRIEASEVLPSERASLERASPPIYDSNLQAFLAWRRSVLFLVAVALVPLSIIGLVDAMAASMPTPIRLVKLGPALAEGLFCWLCWTQLKRWAHWRTQRRLLFWGWLLFMGMPFLVFLYPLQSAAIQAASDASPLNAMGVQGKFKASVTPFVYAMIAMLQLAPKAISLMPGLTRASLVIKLLFPGSTAPGWLIVVCAPLYALLAYVVLIIPYQFTGSGWFIAGVLGVVLGQAILARAGFALARPLLEDEALRTIWRVRTVYLVVMIVSAILVVVALSHLVTKLNMRITDVITAVMKFETNVLILTMIGADLVITNLDRARSHTVGKGHVEEQSEIKIAAFVSLEAPATPPPSGPAQ